MRKTREEKGITLIALIITIVVLLILAVVAINAVTGDGIIQHATNAKEDYEKAQDAEEDMLAYYEGVLQSGEVVPTVEQLQEKYEFRYFSSLKRAIENANGDTTKTADVTTENAVAGIYEDNENKYVVLMKNTQESSTININQSVTLNLGGKTLSLTTDNAYLDFAADITCTIDGRIGGSRMQRNITTTSSKAMINTANNTNLTINSGKYTMEGKFSQGTNILKSGSTDSNGAAVNTSGKINLYNAELSLRNNADTIQNLGNNRLIYTIAEETIIENCKINIKADAGNIINVMFMKGENKISNSNIYSESGAGQVRGVHNWNASNLSISNTEIYTDTNYGVGYNDCSILNKGILKFYSGNVTGVVNALYTEENSQNYIYGGTFAGYAFGGINIRGENGKTYIENTTIKNGTYNGKYSLGSSEVKKWTVIMGGTGNIEVFINNCNIINDTDKNAIELVSGASNNKLYISNSKVTGKITAASGNNVYFGTGMDSITTEQIGANVDLNTYKTISFKGRDK